MPVLLAGSTAPSTALRDLRFPSQGEFQLPSALLWMLPCIQKGSVLHLNSDGELSKGPVTAPIHKPLLSLSVLLVTVQGKLGPICAAHTNLLRACVLSNSPSCFGWSRQALGMSKAGRAAVQSEMAQRLPTHSRTAWTACVPLLETFSLPSSNPPLLLRNQFLLLLHI